ncbi:acetyl-CoA synthetase-like protein [Hypoxylon trugodes]|uniref:acetyl-CoA synthetase-like protein n=1 Tax=Hypoxylon trugodes TaxID=326681 RepID=UPI00219A461E|nr:acetyl-CoA synthetase-like protein [Hypoxylon trugodes]KAI1388114.1 acetyl-CoA synthetase-like protein [Hypoxylon trugodes]
MTPIFPSSLLNAFKATPTIPAFEHGSRVVTRGQVLDLVSRYVGGLSAIDSSLGPGDSIAIYTGVTPEGFAVQVAAHVLGLRVVSLKPGIATSELPTVVADTKVLIIDETTRAEIESAPSLAPSVIRVESLSGDTAILTPQGRPHDVALVLYTSGTTGGPKGVEYTYEAMTASWVWQRSAWDASTECMGAKYERFMLFGTLASTVMFEHLGLCLTGGGTAVIPNTPLPLLKFPDVLAELRISAVLFTVPRLYHVLEVLKSNTSDFDLSHLRSIVVSGSTVPPQKLRGAIERLGDIVHNGYGMSETGLVCLLSSADVAAYPEAASSVGRPWTGVEIQVRDDNGVKVPLGTVGHVWVWCPSAFRSYTNEDSSAVLDVEGWIWTRDLGSLDEMGFVYLTGRARDIVIINANVYHAGAIENALTEHPDVDSAYVVSVPDDKIGEAAVAFLSITLKGRAPNLDALRELVRNKVSPAAVPISFTTVDSVPIAPSGKPDKQALLKLYNTRES